MVTNIGNLNKLAVLQNWFRQEIRSPLLNFRKFKSTEKSTAESCRMYWNLMNDQEFKSFKFLKLKYRRGDQIFSDSTEWVFLKKFGPSSLILGNFKKQRKVLLNHLECIES